MLELLHRLFSPFWSLFNNNYQSNMIYCLIYLVRLHKVFRNMIQICLLGFFSLFLFCSFYQGWPCLFAQISAFCFTLQIINSKLIMGVSPQEIHGWIISLLHSKQLFQHDTHMYMYHWCMCNTRVLVYLFCFVFIHKCRSDLTGRKTQGNWIQLSKIQSC